MGKLDPWILEFKELIDLSVTLFEGQLKSGERIAVVLLDNCVEFMYKAFLRVKKRVVGTGKRHTITHDEWETKVSRRFDELAKAMKDNSKLADDLIEESKHYHLIRNNLYHTDTPTKPVDGVFQEQLKLVLKILETLYGTKHTSASKTILEMKTPIVAPKPISPPAESLDDDLQRQIDSIKEATKGHWRRVRGKWQVVSDLESPEKVMISLLRSYPECKRIKEIVLETNLSSSYISRIISGQKGNHARYFMKCDQGFRLSDEGLYYFIDLAQVSEIMFPDYAQ